jgi:hypothetical protein
MEKERYASLSATRFDGVTTIVWVKRPRESTAHSRRDGLGPAHEADWRNEDAEDDAKDGFIDRHYRIRGSFAGDHVYGR